MKQLEQKIIIYSLLALLAAGLIWGTWQLVSTYISPDLARAWALVATVMLPVVAIASYRLGHIESRGVLTGIDTGVNRVTRAAAAAIDLRSATVSAIKRSSSEPSPAYAVELPQIQPAITLRQLPPGDIVDL